jgi:hypothetical protein
VVITRSSAARSAQPRDRDLPRACADELPFRQVHVLSTIAWSNCGIHPLTHDNRANFCGSASPADLETAAQPQLHWPSAVEAAS